MQRHRPHPVLPRSRHHPQADGRVPVPGRLPALDHPSPARAELSDVGADAWYRTYADWVISVNAFEAPGGVFNPGGVVTRADMAIMMIAAFPHLEAVDEPEGLFQDAQGADPAVVQAIEGMYQTGVTRGCSTSPLNYCPDQPVTRAQMASFFVRAINQAPAAAPTAAAP